MVTGASAHDRGLAPVTWIGVAAKDSEGDGGHGAAAVQGEPASTGLPALDAATTALLAAEDAARAESEADAAADKRARRAENVSMHALTRRGQSKRELEKLLERRELEPEEIASELLRLEGVGLIDDAALAETIVRTHHERKGLGRSALVAELRRRQIDQEHIDAALEQLDGDDELDRARELAEKRAPQLRSLDKATASRRLSGFLMRKGYSGSIVRTAVDEALAGTRPPTGTVRFQ
jgi:regulatory protein